MLLLKWLEEISKLICTYADQVPWLKDFSTSKGLPTGHVVLTSVAAVLIVFVLMMNTDIIVNFIVAYYPAMMTAKVREGGLKEEQKFWLTYWTIFGVVVFTESFFNCILRKIPGYKIVKLSFFVSLMSKRFAKEILVQEDYTFSQFSRLRFKDLINFGTIF